MRKNVHEEGEAKIRMVCQGKGQFNIYMNMYAFISVSVPSRACSFL